METVEANAKKLITPKASTRHHSLQSNCMKVNDSGVIPCGIEFNNLMANKQAGELSAKQEVNSADVLRAELQNKLVKTGTCNNLNEKELLNKEDSIVKENELPFVLVNEAVSENDHTTCLKTFQESTKDSYLETISEEISEKNSPNLKNDNLKSTDKSVLPKPNCPKVHNKGKIYCKTEKVGKPVRRSISMLYRKKMEIRRSTSEKNLNEMKLMSGEKKHHLQSQAFTFEDILGNKSKFANKSVSLFSPEKKVGATSNSLR